MMRLSIVIITRNEEANLGRCIESVKFADEIIVVDSHSEDRTVEIAGQLGAKVFTVDWTGYGPAKQYAAKQASGDWILSIDADEALSPNLADEIRGIVESSPPIDGYDVPRLTNFLGRWIHHCGWYPDRVLRLFRRGRGRFTNATVHEALIVDGRSATAWGICIISAIPPWNCILKSLTDTLRWAPSRRLTEASEHRCSISLFDRRRRL